MEKKYAIKQHNLIKDDISYHYMRDIGLGVMFDVLWGLINMSDNGIIRSERVAAYKIKQHLKISRGQYGYCKGKLIKAGIIEKLEGNMLRLSDKYQVNWADPVVRIEIEAIK